MLGPMPSSAQVTKGARNCRGILLHMTTWILVFLLCAFIIILNERPTVGTNGTWPPGLHVEKLTPCAQRTIVHRGWPYSFYASYVWTPGSPVQVDYYRLCMIYNVLVALLIIVPAVVVWELGIRLCRRRRATGG